MARDILRISSDSSLSAKQKFVVEAKCRQRTCEDRRNFSKEEEEEEKEEKKERDCRIERMAFRCRTMIVRVEVGEKLVASFGAREW